MIYTYDQIGEFTFNFFKSEIKANRTKPLNDNKIKQPNKKVTNKPISETKLKIYEGAFGFSSNMYRVQKS